MSAVDTAIAAAADPPGARVAVDRLLEAHPWLAAELASEDLLARGVVALADASRSLTAALLRDPTIIEPLRDPDRLTDELDGDDYRRRADRDDRDALRRWKKRELARTAFRDLLGLADLGAVGRELAALADAALETALELAEPGPAMAIIGMGKLGGQELNYASDVDVLYVHEGDEQAAVRTARRHLQIMTEATAEGIVFRTDADLRPEGRSGVLSRTVGAYAEYYRAWAGHWEHQALIKARFVAGDPELAGRFFDEVLPTLWEGPLDADALREIRAMKARSEALRPGELKRGPGGIRDVEFATQLLQLAHGRHDASVRARSTLGALEMLARGGYVDPADADHLTMAYRHLRTVEHRLQLRDEQQVYTVPEGAEARTRLARVLGYRDRPTASALEQFDETHRRHLASVRSIHERLFFRPLLDALAGTRPIDPATLADELAGFGFRDQQATQAAVLELTSGFSRTARQFRAAFPLLLGWLSASPNPDLGLLQLRTVADGPVRAGAVVAALRDSTDAGANLCRILGSSKVAGRSLRRHPEALADLADEDQLSLPKSASDLAIEARETVGWRGDDAAERGVALRRFKRREELRIAMRDLLDLLPLEAVGGELTALAEAALQAELSALDLDLPFTVIGMGKLGGAELGYASDLDVIFVHDGDPLRAERAAEAVLRDLGAQTVEGRAWEMDARLRPEGRAGALALTLEGYSSYWSSGRAQLWERQALLRARPVAGDEDLGAAFERWRDGVVFGDALGEEGIREIRRMKARIESERIRPPDDPAFHLKLGPGSLADVEWTVQLLQLLHGAGDPTVRSASTVEGLGRLVAAGLLDPEDGDRLAASYRFCERARNARYLHTGSKADAIPTRSDEAVHLARMLGFVDRPETSLREAYRQVTRRARQVVQRVFYGEI